MGDIILEILLTDLYETERFVELFQVELSTNNDCGTAELPQCFFNAQLNQFPAKAGFAMRRGSYHPADTGLFK